MRYRKSIRFAVVGAMVMALAACAPRYLDASPKLPEEALRFQAGYPQTFDRIVRTLEEDGYAITVADRERGVIETRPRLVKGDDAPGGPFDYRTFLSIRVGGGWRDSWAVVHVLLVPGYPRERERVIQHLQEGTKRP
ncbi:MAG: hypothetical protein HY208_08930 [Nitrospirae bacterium]|nr:hypothetical protein [Nitrospirota bacterium]